VHCVRSFSLESDGKQFTEVAGWMMRKNFSRCSHKEASNFEMERDIKRRKGILCWNRLILP
jgi:hypothetical protein